MGINAFLILACFYPEGAVAPFPTDHPYHILNPWIDTWWHDLSPDQQKYVYGAWDQIEPLMLAVADVAEAHQSAKVAVKDYIHSKFAEVKQGKLVSMAEKESKKAKNSLKHWKKKFFESAKNVIKEKFYVPFKAKKYIKENKDEFDNAFLEEFPELLHL